MHLPFSDIQQPIRFSCWGVVKHSFIHSFVVSFIRLLFHSFVCCFIHSFVVSFIRLLFHSFIRLLFHSFVCCFIHSFVCCFIHSFVVSIIHSFVCCFSMQQDMETVDGVEGATGGEDYGAGSPTYSKSSKFESEDFRYSYASYSGSESPHTNCSTSSNDTDFNRPPSGPPKHVRHNHTYPLQPGDSPREVKAYTKVDKSKHKGPYSR